MYICRNFYQHKTFNCSIERDYPKSRYLRIPDTGITHYTGLLWDLILTRREIRRAYAS